MSQSIIDTLGLDTLDNTDVPTTISAWAFAIITVAIAIAPFL